MVDIIFLRIYKHLQNDIFKGGCSPGKIFLLDEAKVVGPEGSFC